MTHAVLLATALLPAGFWRAVTRLGEAQILLPAALLAAAWLACHGERTTAARWLGAVAAAAALTTATKLAFIGWGLGGSAALDFTGLSGHAMFAAAIFPPLLRTVAAPAVGFTPPRALACGALLALVVAVSRVATGEHSLSESVAGALAGGAASAVALAGAALPRRPAPRWLPLLLAAWLLATPAGAPPSRTHGWVTRLALALSGHDTPYMRADLHCLAAPSAAPAAAPAASLHCAG